MKTLLAVVFATALVASPVNAAATTTVTDIVDNETLTTLVNEEIARLEETNPAVKAALKTQASKNQIIAYVVAGVVATAGAYLVLDKCYLHWLFKTDEEKAAAKLAKEKADAAKALAAGSVTGN